jgi:hypothetical protein
MNSKREAAKKAAMSYYKALRRLFRKADKDWVDALRVQFGQRRLSTVRWNREGEGEPRSPLRQRYKTRMEAMRVFDSVRRPQ